MTPLPSAHDLAVLADRLGIGLSAAQVDAVLPVIDAHLAGFDAVAAARGPDDRRSSLR
jgi:hypothetical protein